MGGERGGIDIDVGRLLVEADVALGVGERAADDGDVDGKRLVAQQLAAIDGQDLGEAILGGLVHASAFKARVAERAKADVSEQTRPAGTDLAKQLHGDATRQDVGLDLVVPGHRLHARRPDPVAADHLAHQSLVRKAVHAARFAIADAE